MIAMAVSACGRIGFDPQLTPAMSPIATAVVVDGDYACALASGAVACWGQNEVGELGNGATAAFGGLSLPPELSAGVTMISGSPSSGHYDHTCAVVDGAALCWGGNLSGELGDGTTTNRSSAAIAVSGQTGPTSNVTSCAFGNPCNTLPVAMPGLASGVQAVIAGYAASCAVRADGSATCWGWDTFGQLGDGGGMDKPDPEEVATFTSGVTSIDIGYESGCGVRDGAIYCWGDNFYGTVRGGDTAAGDSLTPILVRPWP